MNARPILAAAIFAALTPVVALGTVGVAFVMWIGDVNRAKAAANARERARYCDAEPLHFDDETCPRCVAVPVRMPRNPRGEVWEPDEVALAEAVEAAHAPLSWELAKTPAVRAMSLIDSAAFLATARDIDGLGAYVEREWVR